MCTVIVAMHRAHTCDTFDCDIYPLMIGYASYSTSVLKPLLFLLQRRVVRRVLYEEERAPHSLHEKVMRKS